MLIDNYVKQLGFDLKMEGGLSIDEEGVYSLRLSPGIDVTIAFLEQGFEFRGVVGTTPTGGANEEFYSELMLANLLGQGTGNGVLSLDETGAKVILSRQIPYQMTYVQFRDHLEEFFNYAEFWKQRVTEG